MDRRKSGLEGEQYAIKHYEKKGYEFVKSNYHSRFGEIDIIVKNNEYLVFVEVKRRSKNMYFSPAEAVTKSKIQKIVITAGQYILENPTNLQPRFDICEIYDDINGNIERIEVIQNAF